MSLKKPKTTDKIKNFFMMNWWFTGISNIILIILFIYGIMTLLEVEDNVVKRVNLAMTNSIVATPDGRVALVGKQTINTDSEVFTNHIGQIVKMMEASESTLTNGFDASVASTIISPIKLLETNENFLYLYMDFFGNQTIKARFLRFYYNMLKKGELPKKVSILSTEKVYTALKNGGFKIEVTLNVQKDFVDKTSNKSIELVTQDVIIVYGYIDPSKYSSSDNPYGVRFEKAMLNIYTYSDYEGN